MEMELKMELETELEMELEWIFQKELFISFHPNYHQKKKV